MAVYMQYTFAPVVGYSICVCECAMLFFSFSFFFFSYFFSFSGKWNSRYSTVYAERTLYVHVLVRILRVGARGGGTGRSWGRGEGREGERRVGGATSGLIGLCCSRERTGRAAAEAWCSGSWCSLCPGRGGRPGRCTPWLGTTAAGKSCKRCACRWW